MRTGDDAFHASAERRRGDLLLLVSTLGMIGWCVPLALGLKHMHRGSPYTASDEFWWTMAFLLPIAITCGAVYLAGAWLMKMGHTPRQRRVWRLLLIAAFVSSPPGYLLAFVVAFAIGAAKYGIH
mgnify:CR=1 FL=1